MLRTPRSMQVAAGMVDLEEHDNKSAPSGAPTPSRGLVDREEHDRLMDTLPCPALQALLQRLTAERYDNRWWTTRPAEIDDSEVATARRRRAMSDDFDRSYRREAG